MKQKAVLSIAGVPISINRPFVGLLNVIENLEPKGTLHIICDENTYIHCLPLYPFLTEKIREPIIIPAGEQYKNLETCRRVWKSLIAQGANRDSFIINFGGGVVTDLGGFCGATFMRGVRFMHIPTTLLGMCDAAYGGKHGVDFEGLKNYIGIIIQPEHIWVDTRFLFTLPIRHIRNGMAEVIKHALINDVVLFEMLDITNPESVLDWYPIVEHAIGTKKRFVDTDVKDRGQRAALNFGHTIGHALESYFLETETPLLHGECVAMGMIVETWLAHQHFGEPSRETCRDITALIRRLTGVEILEKVRLRELLPLIAKDKKRHGGVTQYSLIRGIGKPVIGQEISAATLESLLQDDEIALILPWLLR